MQTLQHSIEINASKENVWEALLNDKDLRDWTSIIDEGTYMDGILLEGNEVNFISSSSGYGVASKVEKLIPNKYVSFLWTADVKIGEGGSLEKRAQQWTGGKEVYEIEEKPNKVMLTLTQEIPDELVEDFKIKIPQALNRVKILAEAKRI
jgi:uncharacterized protein YndB with AHSA1/START domain